MAGSIGFIDQTSEMGRNVARYDWASTPLGPIESWPLPLKVAVGLVVRSGFAKCLCWGPELIAIYNDGFRVILGDKGDCLGKPFSEIWREAWSDIGPIAEKALAGEATYIQDFPLHVSRGRGLNELAFFTFSYSPVVDDCGRVLGVMDTVIETTNRVTQERSAAIRNRELQHRMKNSYSLIAAVASHTFRHSTDPADIRDKLLRRLQALSTAQEVLALSRGAADTLREVMSYALSPVLEDVDDRISMEGPSVQLSEPQAFALALALHELATNAMKYGALSIEAGRVHISWTKDRAGQLQLRWQESDGPAVGVPETRGFGTFLISDALAAAFNGRVELDYPASGFALTLFAGEEQGRYGNEATD